MGRIFYILSLEVLTVLKQLTPEVMLFPVAETALDLRVILFFGIDILKMIKLLMINN